MHRPPWTISAEELPDLLTMLRARIADPATLPQHRSALVRFERLLAEQADETADGRASAPIYRTEADVSPSPWRTKRLSR